MRYRVCYAWWVCRRGIVHIMVTGVVIHYRRGLESDMYGGWAQTGYDAYYEQSLKLLRPGGLVIIDNVLWGGKASSTSAFRIDWISAFRYIVIVIPFVASSRRSCRVQVASSKMYYTAAWRISFLSFFALSIAFRIDW